MPKDRINYKDLVKKLEKVFAEPIETFYSLTWTDMDGDRVTNKILASILVLLFAIACPI